MPYTIQEKTAFIEKTKAAISADEAIFPIEAAFAELEREVTDRNQMILHKAIHKLSVTLCDYNEADEACLLALVAAVDDINALFNDAADGEFADEWRPLEAACSISNLPMLKILLNNGADPSIKFESLGYSIPKVMLFDEFLQFDHETDNVLACFEYILKNISRPDKMEATGDTSLLAILSLQEPTYEAIKIAYIKAGANLDHKDEDGHTLLYHVAEHLDELELLVGAGADITLKDNDGRTIQDAILESEYLIELEGMNGDAYRQPAVDFLNDPARIEAAREEHKELRKANQAAQRYLARRPWIQVYEFIRTANSTYHGTESTSRGPIVSSIADSAAVYVTELKTSCREKASKSHRTDTEHAGAGAGAGAGTGDDAPTTREEGVLMVFDALIKKPAGAAKIAFEGSLTGSATSTKTYVDEESGPAGIMDFL